MNFAKWILFFTTLTGASSRPNNKTCPSYDGSRYLPVPEEIVSYRNSVCGKLFSTSACCNTETLYLIDNKDSAIFNVHKVIMEPISEACEDVLMQYACLYECSPELDRLKNLTDPLKDVPICKSSCEWWFGACRMETTCTADWRQMFDDTFNCKNQHDSFPNEKDTLLNKFQTAERFCSMMRDAGIAKMVTNDEECFDMKSGRYVEKKSKTTDSTPYNFFAYMGMTVIAIVTFLGIIYTVTHVMKRHRLARSV